MNISDEILLAKMQTKLIKELGISEIFMRIYSDAKEANEIYRSRDASEELFREDKTYLDNKVLRVYSAEDLA